MPDLVINATDARDRVIRLAVTDFEAALALAREMNHPWFGCQALAWVARFAPSQAFLPIIDQALAVASQAKDSYQTVGASAWPVRAMVERGYSAQVDDVIPRVLERATTITNPVSRLLALFLLLQAVFPLGGKPRHFVLSALINACQIANSWRASDTLRETALMLAADDRAEAERVVAAMAEGKYKRQAERRLAAGQRSSPRAFFWIRC